LVRKESLNGGGALSWPALKQQMRALNLLHRGSRERLRKLPAQAVAHDPVSGGLQIQHGRHDPEKQRCHVDSG